MSLGVALFKREHYNAVAVKLRKAVPSARRLREARWDVFSAILFTARLDGQPAVHETFALYG
jgi:hypothetical protein